MKGSKPVLVTGGAGYNGTHVVPQLAAAGERIVVFDDLSTGFADAVHGTELVVGDVGDANLVARCWTNAESTRCCTSPCASLAWERRLSAAT